MVICCVNSRLNVINITFIVIFLFSIKESKSSFFKGSQPIEIPGFNQKELSPYGSFSYKPIMQLSPMMMFSNIVPRTSSSYEETFLGASCELRAKHQAKREKWRRELKEHLKSNKDNLMLALKNKNLELLEELVEERFRLEAQKSLLDEEQEKKYRKIKNNFDSLKDEKEIIKNQLAEMRKEKELLESDLNIIKELMPSNEELQNRLVCVQEEKEQLLIQFNDFADLEEVLRQQIQALHAKNMRLEEEYEKLYQESCIKESLARESTAQLQQDLDNAVGHTIPDEVHRRIGARLVNTPGAERKSTLKSVVDNTTVTINIPNDKNGIVTHLASNQKKNIQENLGF